MFNLTLVFISTEIDLYLQIVNLSQFVLEVKGGIKVQRVASLMLVIISVVVVTILPKLINLLVLIKGVDIKGSTS